MRQRLLPLPARIGVLLRSRSGPLLILAVTTMAMSALEWSSGSFEGTIARLVAVLGLPLVLTTIGADLRKGVAPLWVQKPVDPVRFYVARFGEGVLASVGLLVVIMSVFVAVALRTGWEPVTHPLRLVVFSALFAFVIASVGFGFCVVLPRVGQLATLTLLGITVASDALELLNRSGLDWLGSPLVSIVLFPLSPLVELRAAGGIEPESHLRLLAWVFGYSAAWIGIGAIGVRRAFTRGTWARST